MMLSIFMKLGFRETSFQEIYFQHISLLIQDLLTQNSLVRIYQDLIIRKLTMTLKPVNFK